MNGHTRRLSREQRLSACVLSWSTYLCGILVLLLVAPAWGTDLMPQVRIRAAAEKALALLQRSQQTWDSKQLGGRGCYSCHHQLLPALAYRVAREHGLPVNEQIAHGDAARAFSFFADLDRAVQYSEVVESSMGDGFRLIAEDAAGGKRNLVRAVYARLIALRQNPSGAWDHDSFHERPPSSYSRFTQTALALHAIQLYSHPSQKADTEARVARARQWLLSHTPRDTEERTFQLRGLFWAGTAQAKLEELGRELAATQQSDGGWNSLDGRPSDAYSTAETLAALHDAGGVPVSAPVWQRGIEFLIRTQASDGSWHVATRLHPPAPLSPPYVETGYPYGHDQFLSMSATSWAIMALGYALGPARSVAPPLLPEAEPSNIVPWAESILFGSAADVKRLLDSGFDPNSSTKPGGTTALMMAAPDAEKMKLLLDRGANVNARAKTRYSALLVAAQYPNSSAAIRLLLDRGAEVRLRKGQGAPLYNAHPLFLAAYAGNADILARLRQAGDRIDDHMAVIGQAPVTALSASTELGNIAVVRALLDLGAPIDQGEENDQSPTPLDRAVLGNNVEIASLLIQRGANVNHVDGLGMTPLLYAASVDFGDSAMIELLLKSGANAKARTGDGLTALDLARRYQHSHLLASLGDRSRK